MCSGLDADRKQGGSRVEDLNKPYLEGGDGARLKLRFVQKWSHTRSPQLGEGVFGSLRVTLDLSVLRQDCGVPFCLFLYFWSQFQLGHTVPCLMLVSWDIV